MWDDKAPAEHTPPYVRIADQLRRRIISGQLDVGQALPSYNKIARIHGVAMSTAQKAVGVLRNEGLVNSVNGQATYVIATRSHPPNHGEVANMFAKVNRRIDTLENTLRDLKEIMDRTLGPAQQPPPQHR